MTKYIDADSLRAEIKFAKSVYDGPKRVVYGVADAYRQDGRAAMCDDILKKIDSLQQEPTPDTDALHTELINLLKKYRIGEETARTIADRIADTYGAQRYMDGLCDGLNKEDTKKEQPEVDLEKFTDKIKTF